MKYSFTILSALAMMLLVISSVHAFSFDFGDDDDDDWWRYSYYGNPNQPWIAPNGMYYYPRLPYWERSEMVDRRQYQMERKRRGMQELGDMLYGQNGFDRTRAIQIARAIEATAGQSLSKDFHPGAVASYGSRTSLSLWNNRQAFEGNALALQAAAKALADELVKQPTAEQGAVMLRQRQSDPYAPPSDKQVAVSPDVWQRYNEVSAVCDYCHGTYRGPARW